MKLQVLFELNSVGFTSLMWMDCFTGGSTVTTFPGQDYGEAMVVVSESPVGDWRSLRDRRGIFKNHVEY